MTFCVNVSLAQPKGINNSGPGALCEPQRHARYTSDRNKPCDKEKEEEGKKRKDASTKDERDENEEEKETGQEAKGPDRRLPPRASHVRLNSAVVGRRESSMFIARTSTSTSQVGRMDE